MNIDLAKTTPIEAEIARRGMKLIGRGADRCGPCPICGGRDRFSINLKKQVWNCRGCSKGGDVLDLVQHLDDADFRTAVRTLAGTERKPITPTRPPATSKHDDAENSERALRIWNDASPIAGTLAEVYLHGRKLHDLPGADVLRFHPACPFDGGRQDCLISLYRNIITNEPQAISRAAIDAAGNKIDRLTLGPTKGAAINVDADENVEYGLTVGEGLETCLAARQLGFRPSWSVGSAGAIRNFPVLSGIDALTILVDHDEADRNGRRAGQEAAHECGKRWRAAGREVRLVIPKAAGADIADYFAGGDHDRK
jgi:Toprim domain/CHC2 zinc finger